MCLTDSNCLQTIRQMATQTMRTYPHFFMQRVTSSTKSKQAVTHEEIATVLAKQNELTLLKDKGLFIEIISGLIRRQFISFQIKLRVLKGEMFPVARAQRKKGNANDDDDIPRKRKGKKQGRPVDIKNLVDEASSNPSNVLPLTSQQIRLNQQKEKEDASKGSKPSSRDNDLPAMDDGFVGQITAFEAQMEGTTHLQQPPESDHSNSSSQFSSVSSGIIPNLSQKLKILGGDVSFEGKRTVRRLNTTATRKKGKLDVVDQNISLNDSRETVSRQANLDITLNFMKERARQIEKMECYVCFTRDVDQIQSGLKKRLQGAGRVEKLRSFGVKTKDRRHGGDFRNAQMGSYYENDIGGENAELIPSNYLDLPNTDFSVYKQHLDVNVFTGSTATTVSELAKATNKSRSEVFTNMLFLCQRGEVRMRQDNPQKFGEIVIERLVVEA